ncbi:DNA repair protein RecN [Luteimonas terrae]|uniref:DNA repair protein RecN n=1 Tax=Luteimonas terrae TaxID=1530191 RepID=A0A4R5UD87_9GAMM|nr:DNA repair protein RecN [Luteimonas terrae]TDK33101.1 DNA repair protein RecN [Luteimonas terrae]
MLTHLAIRNFAVASQSDLEFGTGLTVISGETGAGKSLLVDALGFLSGQRADSGIVRHGAERAELHAEFSLDDAAPALRWLRDNELDDSTLGDGRTCQLRRTLRADGGSRAWINGRPATIAQLGELAGHLVEIHGQHEHQALLARGSQLALLDAQAGNGALLADVRAAAQAWRALADEREALAGIGDVGERRDWLRHQLSELEDQALAADAVADLFASHRRHANAAGLIQTCDTALERMRGEDDFGLPQALQALRHDLGRMRAHEPRLGEVDAMLDAAAIQLDEATRLLEQVRDDLDIDPDQLATLESRLGRLHELARKHRVTPEELLDVQTRLSDELDQLDGAGERLQQLDGEIEAAFARWRSAAGTLGTARRKAAKALSSATTALIHELGMGGGVFEVAIEAIEATRPDPQGAERVEFMVSANAGQPPRALRKVASGGELSRISLAIEVAALGHDAVPTMVFDEVDSGIGGAVADIVGRKLRALGASRQVLCVTHLPQVAAKGHAHYRVHKAASEGATESHVTRLDERARAEELARMLGGVEVSKEARAAARKLLATADA